jgi:hypothetical protein
MWQRAHYDGQLIGNRRHQAKRAVNGQSLMAAAQALNEADAGCHNGRGVHADNGQRQAGRGKSPELCCSANFRQQTHDFVFDIAVAAGVIAQDRTRLKRLAGHKVSLQAKTARAQGHAIVAQVKQRERDRLVLVRAFIIWRQPAANANRQAPVRHRRGCLFNVSRQSGGRTYQGNKCPGHQLSATHYSALSH